MYTNMNATTPNTENRIESHLKFVGFFYIHSAVRVCQHSRSQRELENQPEEAKKGGGLIYTGTALEADTEAIATMAGEIAAGNIDTDLLSDTDEEEGEEEPIRGQMRFYRRTGHKMAAIQPNELNAVKIAVAAAILAAGGNPSLITAIPTG
ncbi:hypothetical protein CYMTET_34066 [Cymbomonas tetramitiformis]|uniref:Uncharacterized protein n=1 Tax=Cymbomonas tetramitiformis TaxID=36881 RepID=A0AAE0FBY7_9CHLO|nr:hypothetical protein CYMTET_34066 [Cymbomonas tetramitiformis]